MKNMKIDANGTEIKVMGDVVNEDAYISLTDIAKYKNPDNAFIVVANWMRNYSTISFLGLWEQIHNPNFKPIEFDGFKAESGDNVRCTHKSRVSNLVFPLPVELVRS
mgnify:CR=1 FL=1